LAKKASITGITGQDGSYLAEASSSEMFGSARPPQSETTPFQPQSPYAAAKVYAYWLVRNYREGYGIFAANGILFNHESPRRGETFVTRKITRANVCVFLTSLSDGRFDALLAGRTEPGGAPYHKTPMPLINIGAGKDATVAELAAKVAEVVGYEGPIVWDSGKPDGTPRKLLDVSRMAALGWRAKISLGEGLHSTYDWYRRQLKR